ncbi:hypothetical protein PoB_002911600 [Plakobranchus ocellatus]|uniref:Uncharacterized protein n=1 Tax=Plakobranchus ocellatus TaxID=259542 RepID=A0AAV4A7G4_9GAST|nr:hypothetical protein PoB_002911600 [Plakobranchus ocellatus]
MFRRNTLLQGIIIKSPGAKIYRSEHLKQGNEFGRPEEAGWGLGMLAAVVSLGTRNKALQRMVNPGSPAAGGNFKRNGTWAGVELCSPPVTDSSLAKVLDQAEIVPTASTRTPANRGRGASCTANVMDRIVCSPGPEQQPGA